MRLLQTIPKFFFLTILSVWLTACGGGGGGGGGDDITIGDDGTALENIDGTWLSNCDIDAPSDISSDLLVIAINGDLTVIATAYGNLSCNNDDILIQETVTATYILGSAVTVDGSVAGITTATEIDITDTTAGSPEFGETSFELVAIKDNEAYFGDCDGVNDCSTETLRATQLSDTIVLTKQ
jgi:hypothetical protein